MYLHIYKLSLYTWTGVWYFLNALWCFRLNKDLGNQVMPEILILTLLYGVMKSTLDWHVHRYQKLRWNNTVFVPLCLQYKTQSHSSHKNSGTLLAKSLIWHVHCWKLPLPHNYGLSFIIFKVTYSLIKYKIHYRQAHKTLAHYGIPDVLVTDSRAQYAADSFHKLTEWWELSHLLSNPGIHQTNGAVETEVNAAKRRYKKCKATRKDPYLLQLNLRTLQQRQCMDSPAQ